MSYEKVRSVRFLSDDNIIIESVSNNVSPKKYHKWKFTGTIIDFLKYVQGSELQIATSANGYFWSALFAISYKVLKVQNIEYSDLYSLDKDNPIWDDIVETFHTAMNYLKANRNKKCYVKMVVSILQVEHTAVNITLLRIKRTQKNILIVKQGI